ncbi:hypothetical protein KAU11_02460, partial [Candidatus Babeliales bacterium]|nr:hypothetical protein [Candidatus Babeliales bacterium]
KDGEPEQQLEAVLSQIDSSPQLESVVEIASTFGEQIQKKIKIKKTIKCLKKLIEIYKSIKKTTQETDEFLKANQDLETRFKASRKEYKERLIHAADTAKKGKGKALTKKTEATDNLVKNVYYQNYLLKDGDLKNTKQSHEAAKQKLDSIDKKQNPIGYGLAKQEALRAQSKLKKCKSELEEIFHKFSREHSQYNQASQNLDQADKLLKSQEKNRDAYDEKKLSKEEYVSRTIYGYARRWKTIGWTIGVGTSIILYSNIRNYISEYKKHIESNNKKKKKSQEAPLRAGQHVRRFFKQFRFAPISIKHLVGLMAIGAGTTMLAFRGLEKIAENSVTTAS